MAIIASFTSDHGKHEFNARTFCNGLIEAGLATPNQAAGIARRLRDYNVEAVTVERISKNGPFYVSLRTAKYGHHWTFMVSRVGKPTAENLVG